MLVRPSYFCGTDVSLLERVVPARRVHLGDTELLLFDRSITVGPGPFCDASPFSCAPSSEEKGPLIEVPLRIGMRSL
ncbi:hypothetical protein AMJ82_06220 [candidate division TA06 bacterium SM23_40]|nr:MAG: hypothetical protein AMJ82_06220 [candidate division TA06 bacterium SM23_40]